MIQDEAIAAGLRIFVAPGHAFEIRALGAGGRAATSRTFTDIPQAIRFALEMEAAGATGVYFTANPVRRDLVGSRSACKKDDILRRHWLLVDCDSVRAPKTNANDEEREQAHKVLEAAHGALIARGFVNPVTCDSGNGFHLCFPIDLPNDQSSHDTLKGVLKGLAHWANSPRAIVDTSTHDAPRIWKLPGTTARKGPPTHERPHRRARVLSGEPWDATAAASNNQALTKVLATWQWIKDRRSGRKETGPPLTYAETALQAELTNVAGAVVGERNNVLNKAAFSLGQLVAAGALDRQRVEQELRFAGEQVGLEPGEVGRTIQSGMDAGMSQPRDLSGVGTHQRNGPGPPASAAFKVEDIPEQPPIDRSELATPQDLVDAGSNLDWLWDGWIQRGVCVALAAVAGTGKTRFVCDLLRRIRHQLPWPDERAMNLPADTATLWVASDWNHDELVDVAQTFKIMDCIWFNTTKREPFGGTSLDNMKEVASLQCHIRACKPTFVVIDTVGAATSKDLTRQEEARAFYAPLQKLAVECRVAILCLTHLSTAGEFMGRRILEKCRLGIKMEKPDPHDDRLIVWMQKSNAKKPKKLGITMGDLGNEYSTELPSFPDRGSGRGPGRPQSLKYEECLDWLYAHLSTGAKQVGITLTAAENAGFSKPMVYRVSDDLKVDRYEAENYKWWRLPSNGK